MARNLDEMQSELERGLNDLKAKKQIYGHSLAFINFVAQKQRDYEEFMRFVRPALSWDTHAAEVVRYLREKKAPYKFFGMTQRTYDYFKITDKLLKLINERR